MPSTLDQSSTADKNLQPPRGDNEKAENYISKLIGLLNQDLIFVYQTDLGQFDPSALQNHYRINLKSYQVEVSHSKMPDTGKDSFVMLFTNIDDVKAGLADKAILAYIYLDQYQYTRFKEVADEQIARITRIKEEKRFKSAMEPVDDELDQITSAPLEMISDPNPLMPPAENLQEEIVQPSEITSSNDNHTDMSVDDVVASHQENKNNNLPFSLAPDS